jgi:cytochrome bd ubiquinol oxidase subunit II
VHLYALPLLFVLGGLALYVVLGGADFGAGFWQLTAGRGPDADELRDEAHRAIGPVWEANHVWLIFVLTVSWTAYPRAFGAIASTLAVPLFIAAIGIIFRGLAYALRSGTSSARERRLVDAVFSVSSLLTPFALGTAAGGIASLRIPVGNAAGSELTSWLNPTSVTIGVLAVAASAYLAAVFLCADSVRHGRARLEERFRRRALAAGLVAGALAVAALAVLADDAHPLFHHLVDGAGLAGVAVSLAAGCTTLALVWRRRYEPARYSAALAVAAIVAGWALAQQPRLLADLTIRQAAAPRATLLALTVAVLAGGAILFPSLALLFRFTLSGRLSHGGEQDELAARTPLLRVLRPGLSVRVAIASLAAGFVLLTIANPGWAHAAGVTCLLVFIALAFPAVLPKDEAEQP